MTLGQHNSCSNSQPPRDWVDRALPVLSVLAIILAIPGLFIYLRPLTLNEFIGLLALMGLVMATLAVVRRKPIGVLGLIVNTTVLWFVLTSPLPSPMSASMGYAGAQCHKRDYGVSAPAMENQPAKPRKSSSAKP